VLKAQHTEGTYIQGTFFMPNTFGAPEISVQDVAAKVTAKEEFVWLDVREPDELATAAINDERVVNVPLSLLAQQQTAALPTEAQAKDAEIVVFCHHGGRSGQVTAWLRGQGWTNVLNMEGGIDNWARTVDASVARY
jgi:rhodanese-related sulfurtransferase